MEVLERFILSPHYWKALIIGIFLFFRLCQYILKLEKKYSSESAGYYGSDGVNTGYQYGESSYYKDPYHNNKRGSAGSNREAGGRHSYWDQKPSKTSDFGDLDPYMVLGVSRNATGVEVRAAYLRMAKRFHPDKVPRSDPGKKRIYTYKMQRINDAYTKLRDTRYS